MTRIPIDDENHAAQAREPADEGHEDDGAQAPAAAADSQPQDIHAGDVERLQAERDDLYQRLARATADFKNTQKRLQSEADQRVQYANQSLIKSLLPVIDNFERALAQD